MCMIQTVKNLPAVQETHVPSLGRKIPWRRVWQPSPVFLPGESHGQRSLAGYSPCSHGVGRNWVTNTFTCLECSLFSPHLSLIISLPTPACPVCVCVCVHVQVCVRRMCTHSYKNQPELTSSQPSLDTSSKIPRFSQTLVYISSLAFITCSMLNVSVNVLERNRWHTEFSHWKEFNAGTIYQGVGRVK